MYNFSFKIAFCRGRGTGLVPTSSASFGASGEADKVFAFSIDPLLIVDTELSLANFVVFVVALEDEVVACLRRADAGRGGGGGSTLCSIEK